jgi:hypothetical protein
MYLIRKNEVNIKVLLIYFIRSYYYFSFSTRPTVNVFSTTDSVARCYNSSVSIDSNITVAETDFSVDAFGIHIWYLCLSF